MNNNKKLFELMMTTPEIKKLVSQIGPIINLDAPEDKDKLQKIIIQMVDPDNIWLLICAVLDTSGGTDEIIRKYLYLIKRRYVNQIINQELNNIFKADK
tara:strand:+ start:1598 stop:1894 length:297 start_codon:yes stop_codon:yes gene_type:complete